MAALFLIDLRHGIVGAVERSERDEVAAIWARLMQDEADNFESDCRWHVDSGVVVDLMQATVLA